LIDMFFPKPLKRGIGLQYGLVDLVKLAGWAQRFEEGDGTAGAGCKGRILAAAEQADFLADELWANSRDGVQDIGLNRCEGMRAHRAAMTLGNQRDKRCEEADDLGMKPVTGLACRGPAGIAMQEGVDRGMGHAARLANLEPFEHGAPALSEA